MLFMVIEHFRNEDPVPVYQRFRDQGRLAPEGLRYVDSWITADMARCFQVMECDDVTLLQRWIASWSDLVRFEVVPIATSKQTVEAIAPVLPASPTG